MHYPNSNVNVEDYVSSLRLNPDIKDCPAMLPNKVYSSPEIQALEIEKVFGGDYWIPAFDTWWCDPSMRDPVVRADNPGDVTPFTFFDRWLALARDENGDQRCFHRVCTHWGLRDLCPMRTNVLNKGELVCPLHGRSFDLAGRSLADVPDLPEVRVESWHGLLNFISLGNPRGFSDVFKTINESGMLKQLLSARRVHKATTAQVMEGNWKLHFLLNLDPHHVWMIHKGLMALMKPRTYREELFLENPDVVLQWAEAIHPKLGLRRRVVSSNITGGVAPLALWYGVFPSTAVLWGAGWISVRAFFPHGTDPSKTILYRIDYATNKKNYRDRDRKWHYDETIGEDNAEMPFMNTSHTACGGRTGKFSEREELGHWFQSRYVAAIQGAK